MHFFLLFFYADGKIVLHKPMNIIHPRSYERQDYPYHELAQFKTF